MTDPSIIFLDEPTSGLDAFAAKQLMELLKKVAEAGNTVLFTIHQPSARIFFSFDKLILLNRGELMHIGRTSDVPRDFLERSFPVPDNTNAADWILVGAVHPLLDSSITYKLFKASLLIYCFFCLCRKSPRTIPWTF